MFSIYFFILFLFYLFNFLSKLIYFLFCFIILFWFYFIYFLFCLFNNLRLFIYFIFPLQTLYVPKILSSCDITEIIALNAVITCQHPQADLYSFHGKIDVNMGSETMSRSLTIDNVLLRGSRLKDTDYVIGCSIYTGEDTKLSLNSKQIVNKFSTAEKWVNYLFKKFFFSSYVNSFVSSFKLDLFYGDNFLWDKFQCLSTFINCRNVHFNFLI